MARYPSFLTVYPIMNLLIDINKFNTLEKSILSLEKVVFNDSLHKLDKDISGHLLMNYVASIKLAFDDLLKKG